MTYKLNRGRTINVIKSVCPMVRNNGSVTKTEIC